MKQKKTVSWVWVILALIFFWPIGAYLFYKRITTDKAGALRSSKLLKILGWIGICMGMVYAIGCAGDETVGAGELIGPLVFFVVCGAVMIYAGKRVKESGQNYNKYIDIIVNHQQASIQNIASAMSLSYEKTIKDLESLIDGGYLSAYIDYGNHEIVLTQKQQNPMTRDVSPQPKLQDFVLCKNCGGNNKVTVGIVCECEFCGSPISKN